MSFKKRKVEVGDEMFTFLVTDGGTLKLTFGWIKEINSTKLYGTGRYGTGRSTFTLQDKNGRTCWNHGVWFVEEISKAPSIFRNNTL